MVNLSTFNSIANHIIAELRDVQVQKDSQRFRKNMEKLGGILAYEASKNLSYQPTEIQTPLGKSPSAIIDTKIVIATILRAGVPLYQGVLNYFDKADSAFVGAFRNEDGDAEHLTVSTHYTAGPSIKDKILIIADPMIATGKSLLSAYQAICKGNSPKELLILSAIASQPGIDFLEKHLSNFSLYVGAVDPQLNQHAYIVPGLGDAGDLAFGEKI
ncbi:uracil phosphoribosyltransferase [Rapidithrix thailandica]|uniref:Uracil phosphoribosyltransferase n=1 Tax=Rapidithrix thailandica TaxID=413964 RepID=A0AAW9SBN4_9BACT